MKPTFSIRRLKRWLLASSVLPGCLVVGCQAPYQTRFDRCATIVPGSLPAPNGSFVRQFQLVQTNKAEMDDFVIYAHEWYMSGKDLGPYGEYHVVQIAQRMPFVPYPVLIEVSLSAELNECRRRLVIERLASFGVTDAANRVVLGRPEAEGLNGPESFRVYQGLLFNTGQGGGGGNGFGGNNFGGGFGGGGLGGGFGGGGFGGGLGGFPFPSY
jgi:uncharacterized membrane protein YgcG